MSNKTIYLKDYKVPNFLIKTTNLDFNIFDSKTTVTSEVEYYKNTESSESNDLFLNGRDLELVDIFIDGKQFSEYEKSGENLILKNLPDSFNLKIITNIHPETNSSLEGLYKSSNLYCTQCEAQGFRRITYYPDRPDVMSVFTTSITADKSKFPILLSNGNNISSKENSDGTHTFVWHDPFKKPSYLFALVAGDLEHISDKFTTCSGRNVDLKIFASKENIEKCSFAMGALKRSMEWDEKRFGREYDLDLFMIVGVDDFNAGAMENKGLNIFNSSLIFATPETATDADYIYIERVIGHEYFHNWSGDRVTCRDWFQLSLKEGFTVYRDSEFTSDLHNRTLKRIDDVNLLKNHQFKEDSSPLAHPIRPASFEEIQNFYTVTVYEKGAEVVKIYETILGKEGFRKATDLYFDRHDGQAVTTEDFLKCMSDSSGYDFSQMQNWYSQAGTPNIYVKDSYDSESQTYTISFNQSCPETPETKDKKPFLIPVKFGLLDKDGKEIEDKLLILKEFSETFTFKNIDSKPVPSILRGFSAPVNVDYDYSLEDYLFLMNNDTDEFNKYDAGQKIFLHVILDFINNGESNYLSALLDVSRQILKSDLDNGMKARMLNLPSETEIWAALGQNIDPELVHNFRERLLKELSLYLYDDAKDIYDSLNKVIEYKVNENDISDRSLKNNLLFLLSYNEDGKRAYSQYVSSNNMTDTIGSLKTLVNGGFDESKLALDDFINKWSHDKNVVDKWLSIQSMSKNTNSDTILELTKSKYFDPKNPNKVRSLFSVFSTYNLLNFHSPDGSGYKLLADKVIESDKFNSHISLKLLKTMINWKILEPKRQELLKAELIRISNQKELSGEVSEILAKSL